MSSLTPDRAWSTWDPRFPACMLHIPSRFAVRIAMFSATENRYHPFPAFDQLSFELGEHASDGAYVALRVHAADTTLAIEFARGPWPRLYGRVTIVEPGEMLFRLGILVEAGFLAPATGDARVPAARMVDRATRELALADADVPPTASAACGRWRSQHFAVAVSPTPAIAGQYATPAAVADDLEHRGWLYHPPAAPDGDWVAWRFYGDPRRPVTLALAQDNDPAAAQRAAREGLSSVASVLEAARERAAGDGSVAARAIRDVMAWNTVWDPANHRPYTSLSRGWVDGFGGWGIWMSDAFYNGLLSARAGDWLMARANLEAVISAQQPAGNLPCLVGADEEWIDRTQLPVGAFMTWRTYLLTEDRALLAECYPALCRHLEWVARERDGNDNGLYEYGSTPLGHAQGAFTLQGALNESGMDNLAVFDDARFVPEAHTIDLEEPGHNSLLALEWEALSWIAGELGLVDEAAEHLARARALATRISEQLWDPERQIFAARHWDGRFAEHLSPTSFFPLVCGAASDAQVQALLGHLFDEATFWGPLPLPSAPHDDPVGEQDSYWRGRIWPPHLYWVWEGLRRSGLEQQAARLAHSAWEMFDAEWSTRRHSHENFNGRDPERHDAHDSDPFYSWGVLIAFMAEAERADAGPWEGLSLGDATGEPGTLTLPGRRFAVFTDDGLMRVSINGRARVAVAPPARLTRVHADGETIGFVLSCARELFVPAGATVTVDGRPRSGDADEGMLRLADVSGEVTVRTPGPGAPRPAKETT